MRLPGGPDRFVSLREMWARGRLRVSRPHSATLTVREVADAFGAAEVRLAPPRVDCIVFSKDRAMQLDACLRGIIRHAPYDGSIVVIYRATTDAFRDAYARIRVDRRVRLVPQGRDFSADVLGALDAAKNAVVFHTDDEVFFRRPPHAPQLPTGCAAFSLRLGTNTTYCYPMDRDQPIPEGVRVAELLVWDWSSADADFAYPLSLNGHIFDAVMIRSLIADLKFGNPNDLERELHLRRHRVPRVMASFSQSSVVAIPVNVVTETVVNRSGFDPHLSPQTLNEQFLGGLRIDLDAMDFSTVHAAHQEIELVLSQTTGGAEDIA